MTINLGYDYQRNKKSQNLSKVILNRPHLIDFEGNLDEFREKNEAMISVNLNLICFLLLLLKLNGIKLHRKAAMANRLFKKLLN